MTSVHSTPRLSSTAAASAATDATGTGYSGVLERPVPGASKLMIRRFGKYRIKGSHMSALEPRPGTRNRGLPAPSSDTQIRCPRQLMISRSTSSLSLPQEFNGALPQCRRRPAGDDADVAPRQPQDLGMRHDRANRIDAGGRRDRVLLGR